MNFGSKERMNTRRKIKVLLFKAEKDGVAIDPYAKLLASNGFEVFFAPVLSYRFSTDGMEQVSILLRSQVRDQQSGNEKAKHIVLTSPRAADAVVAIISQLGLDGGGDDGKDKDCRSLSIRNTNWYAVGNETGSRLHKCGITSKGSESGSAQELSEFLVKQGVDSVSFLCGDKRRDTLPKILRENKIPCEEICIYKSIASETVHIPAGFFEENADAQGENLVADRWCVFFSPSGVRCMSRDNNYKNLVKKLPGVGEQSGLQLKCMAIGKTSAAEISLEKHTNLWKVDAIAPKPSPQGVLDALISYYNSC